MGETEEKRHKLSMMEDIWTIFCGESDCYYGSGKQCSSAFMFFNYPSSCINNVLVLAFDVLLLLMLLFNFIHKPSPAMFQIPSGFQGLLPTQIFSAFFNGGLGVIYFSYGIWILQENMRNVETILPLHQWLVLLFQGLTWLLVALVISLWGKQLPKAFLRLWSALACLFAGILCVSSLLAATIGKEASVRIILDVLSLPGAILFLLCSFKVYKYNETGDAISSAALYTPLNAQTNCGGKADLDRNVTPFADSGFMSKMSFSWLNPLMRKGPEITLEEEDIPRLRELDTAETCYTLFMEQLNKKKQSNLSTLSSILWIIVSCHWKEILISGFFALLKIITLSAGPLLLNAFIQVAEGKEIFKYEGYVLATSLFIAKCLESLSQRQWFFRSRIIGLRIRSLLLAAIYKKQLRLSNAAKVVHSAGNIMNYVTVDSYRVGEFPYRFHQTWTTGLQLCIVILILFHAVGVATFAALAVLILTVLCNTPLAKLQNKFQTKLMVAQDERLKACSEVLVNMKVLKLYGWETHFKDVIERLRSEEYTWLSAVQMKKAYNLVLFWSSPVLISAATFGACHLIGISLNASNVFTFIATLRIVQDPVTEIPDIVGVAIQAKISLERIVKFLDASELQKDSVRQHCKVEEFRNSVSIKSVNLSWEENPSKLTLRNINLVVKPGEKVAICGEVGSGKSTLLAAILGEVAVLGGTIQVYGKIAYVSQMAWIQTGTIQENILFGSSMDKKRYKEVLEKCSLVKDLEMLPYSDLTEIGERGVNLSGGQKQRIQLARALYQDADIYLLDDPFSAVDAHTATSLFSEYVIGALSGKAVLLVTHQLDFLPAFDSVLLMSDGEILHAAPYYQLLASSQEFQELVSANNDTTGSEKLTEVTSPPRGKSTFGEIKKTYSEKQFKATERDQLIKKEEREIGDTGFRPFRQYLYQNKGFLYFTVAGLCHIIFVAGQISQNFWMAANVQNPHVSQLSLIIVYVVIGCVSTFIMLFRSLTAVVLCIQSSKSIFSQLLNSLLHAPMSFYDSTPLGRILSRVSSDLSIVDLDVPFSLIFTFGPAINVCGVLGVLAVVTWQVLLVSIPMIFLTLRFQKYYLASAKEFMRINGTTKSLVANHLAESIAGAMTIRAFEDEERFFAKNFNFIDRNARPFFHYFAANEWLIQRIELLSAAVLSSSALAIVLLPLGTFGSGFVGMALSYGLSLNMSLIHFIQNQCMLADYIVSVERLNQYMHIPSEAPEVIQGNRPPPTWPAMGKVEIHDLQIRYRPSTPLVLSGISCTFEGGHKIGIVGRTGSGKTTLISALFRLVEPTDGKIIIDNLDISMIGLHDLRSRIGIIPQHPMLFNGTLRYNLDPLSQYTDNEVWEVLRKCQLQEVVQEKENGLDALVTEDGSNWSMGQQQLFCLGRALLRRSQILVLDEATASIDNATDAVLQKTIRIEFADCTVITVAHRIPTVMDCTKVLAMSDGKVVEFDEPAALMKREVSLFGHLVKEYRSHFHSANQH